MKQFFNRIRYDILLALVLLGVAGGIFAVRYMRGGAVSIHVNGAAVTESMEVNGVVVEVDGARARIAQSPCRDQICVRAGWLERPGDTAICLPQRVAVEIVGGRGKYDGVAY